MFTLLVLVYVNEYVSNKNNDDDCENGVHDVC